MATRTVLFCAICLLVGACDYGSDAITGPRPVDAPLLTNDVFDGRDSVATGIDGFVATQANFSIVTDFLRIRSSDEIVLSGFVSITDPGTLDPATLLFESRELNPIVDPDGEPVTWGQFSTAEGAVTAKCTKKGTHIVTHLSGLRPKGLYSVWVDLLESGTRTRIGRFRYTDRSAPGRHEGNTFRASKDGEGHLSGLVAPRKVNSLRVSACMLNDVIAETYDFHVVGVYHIDGTSGVDQVDSGTFVEQVAFLFRKSGD